MACRCSSETLKASLIIGSILTWTLGIVIFGLCLATIRKPVFMPSLIPMVSTVYDSLVVALSGSIFICVLALLGCCGGVCKSPCLLIVYATGLIILFVYQMVDGISLLYEKQENFPSVQFLSVDLCEYEKKQGRGRQGRLLSAADLVESVTRAEANARTFNRNVALLLEQQKAKGLAVDCVPIKDLLSPTAALLFLASGLYLYLGFCAVQLAQNLWKKRKLEQRKRQMQRKPKRQKLDRSLDSDEYLERFFCAESPILVEHTICLSGVEYIQQSPEATTSVATVKEGKMKTSPVILSSRMVYTVSPTKQRHRSTSTVSSEYLYSTPPLYPVPKIVLCPPTP